MNRQGAPITTERVSNAASRGLLLRSESSSSRVQHRIGPSLMTNATWMATCFSRIPKHIFSLLAMYKRAALLHLEEWQSHAQDLYIVLSLSPRGSLQRLSHAVMPFSTSGGCTRLHPRPLTLWPASFPHPRCHPGLSPAAANCPPQHRLLHCQENSDPSLLAHVQEGLPES